MIGKAPANRIALALARETSPLVQERAGRARGEQVRPVLAMRQARGVAEFAGGDAGDRHVNAPGIGRKAGGS